MKDALPAHLTRACWLAETLPPARIICATTHAALDVLLYRTPAKIETVADPGESTHQVDIASYVLERAQPEPDHASRCRTALPTPHAHRPACAPLPGHAVRHRRLRRHDSPLRHARRAPGRAPAVRQRDRGRRARRPKPRIVTIPSRDAWANLERPSCYCEPPQAVNRTRRSGRGIPERVGHAAKAPWRGSTMKQQSVLGRPVSYRIGT